MLRNRVTALLFVVFVLASTPLVAQQSAGSGVAIVTNIEGARVYVDDAYRGVTEAEFGAIRFSVDLEPGDHELRVEPDNYSPISDTITVSVGSYLPYEAIFETSDRRVQTGEAVAQSAQILIGSIVVKTDPPGATVVLNSDRLGSTANGASRFPVRPLATSTSRSTLTDAIRRSTWRSSLRWKQMIPWWSSRISTMR